MNVEVIAPYRCKIEVSELIDRIDRRENRRLPFSGVSVDFCDALSEALFSSPDTRKYPEIHALAFWLRRSSIAAIERDFRSKQSPTALAVPRGVAFHITPANVDTIFVYSWILSLLAGNSNILRVSKRAGETTRLLCSYVSKLIGENERFLEIRNSLAMVEYDHNDEITAAFSRHSDLRIIWGGDHTVTSIRAFSAKPATLDLSFADRFSFAALSSEAVDRLTDVELSDLCTKFYNDSYWFTQMGCSSPRAVFWVGTSAASDCASRKFTRALQEIIARKGFTNETGAALNVMSFSYAMAASERTSAVQRETNELSVIHFSEFKDLHREHCGHGTFLYYQIDELGKLAPAVTGKDQTLSYFGFSKDSLRSLVQDLRGTGIDRVVPIGTALSFSPIWDGYDLLTQMSKQVTVP